MRGSRDWTRTERSEIRVHLFDVKKARRAFEWLPLADTLLTQTPKYGSSNMMRMRKLVNDIRFSASADAARECFNDNIPKVLIQDLEAVMFEAVKQA